MGIITFHEQRLAQLIGLDDPQEIIETLPHLGMTVEEYRKEKGEIDCDITPNRIDMYTHEGMARALASFLGKREGLRKYVVESPPSSYTLTVDPSVKTVRPFVVAAVIHDVTLDDISTLMQVQEKIHDTYGRKRKKVAIGVHDFDAVRPPFTYTAVKPDDYEFVPLEKSEQMTPAEILRTHEKGIAYAHLLANVSRYPLILDREGVVSFPPIINAERTRLTEKSKRLFIEMTGTNREALHHALTVLCTSFADRGSRIVGVTIIDEEEKSERVTPDLSAKPLHVPVEKANALLGISLTPEKMAHLLRRMGYEYDGHAAYVPCYRADVMDPVDVIEDVAIAYGYNNFAPELPPYYTVAHLLSTTKTVDTIKHAFVAMGAQECISFTLSNPEKNTVRMLLLGADAACFGNGAPVRMKNPLTTEYTMIRTWLLPSLLSNHANNEKLPQKLFEVGSVASNGSEWCHVGWTIMDESVSFVHVQAMLERLAHTMKWELHITPTHHPTFIPGRVGEVRIDGVSRGIIGEVHPKVIRNYGLEYPIAACEIVVRKIG